MKQTIILSILVSILLVSCGPADSTALQASGLIEATEVSVAPEMSGQVAEVFVSESDPVKAGDPILRIKDELLSAQRDAASAAVETAKSAYQAAEAAYASAQTQYEIALEAARAADSSSRTQDWIGRKQDNFDQPNWYFTRPENIQATQLVIETAQKNLDAAQANLTQVINDLDNADFLEAEKHLADARIAYLVTKDVYDRAS
jgi:multidrug resistance efflux pump